MNVTSIVQSWINGIEYDYGFVVIDSNESNADHWTTWYSSDANSPHKPELIITYSNSADILYTHYYDSTFSTDRVNQITSASRTAGMAYLRQFGLYFGSSGAPDRLSTLTDECPLGANVHCSSSCDPHHKNARRNASILHNDAASNERVVFWTNHTLGTYCEHDKQTDECYLLGGGGDVLAGVYIEDFKNAIQLFHLLVDGNTAAEYVACMGITLIHETTHTFGLEDSYKSVYATEHNPSGYQCVMEFYQKGEALTNFYAAIKNGQNAFCSFCEESLKAQLP